MTDEGIFQFDVQIALPVLGAIAANNGTLAPKIAIQRRVASDVWS